jgi:hypothetical protein
MTPQQKLNYWQQAVQYAYNENQKQLDRQRQGFEPHFITNEEAYRIVIPTEEFYD